MRLFFALDIPANIREQVIWARQELARDVWGVKWVEDHNLHLTMKFLGEVPEPKLKEIAAAARTATEGLKSFSLSVGGPGYFPNARNPRVIWLAINDPQSGAVRVGHNLDDSLVPLGFEPEKRRQLHLTLGRIKNDAATAALLQNGRSFTGFKGMLSFIVNELVLYRSELSRHGPSYFAMEKFELIG